MDVKQTIDQIGKWTHFAVSGGRVTRVSPDTLRFPIQYGYSVEVTLEPTDVYTVRQVWQRGLKRIVKNEWRDVYAEQLSDTVYRASLR